MLLDRGGDCPDDSLAAEVPAPGLRTELRQDNSRFCPVCSDIILGRFIAELAKLANLAQTVVNLVVPGRVLEHKSIVLGAQNSSCRP